MNERTRERKFLARKQSSHELILAAKASNGGGHSSCSTDTTPGGGSGWPRLRGSGGVPGVRCCGRRCTRPPGVLDVASRAVKSAESGVLRV